MASNLDSEHWPVGLRHGQGSFVSWLNTLWVSMPNWLGLSRNGHLCPYHSMSRWGSWYGKSERFQYLCSQSPASKTLRHRVNHSIVLYRIHVLMIVDRRWLLLYTVFGYSWIHPCKLHRVVPIPWVLFGLSFSPGNHSFAHYLNEALSLWMVLVFLAASLLSSNLKWQINSGLIIVETMDASTLQLMGHVRDWSCLLCHLAWGYIYIYIMRFIGV